MRENKIPFSLLIILNITKFAVILYTYLINFFLFIVTAMLTHTKVQVGQKYKNEQGKQR